VKRGKLKGLVENLHFSGEESKRRVGSGLDIGQIIFGDE